MEGVEEWRGRKVLHLQMFFELLVAEVEALGGYWVAHFFRYFSFKFL